MDLRKLKALIDLVEKSAEFIDMNVNKSLTLEAMAFKLHL